MNAIVWFFHHLLDAALMSASMVWDVAWSLVLGFVISGLLQVVVSQERLQRALGGNGLRQVALATGFGAASSSCSYASAAISRTLFTGGAGLVPSLAFLMASTNLVVELGVVLWLLMGWQFTAAEWLGGLVLIGIMWALVRLTYPAALAEAARAHAAGAGGHSHAGPPVAGDTLWQKLRQPETPMRVAQSVVMDARMLWKDLAIGFVVAGVLAAFVPPLVWSHLFLHHSAPWVRVVVNAVIGPLLAIVTFVCSIGNVPMAAILWAGGAGFGGVLSFLYADLIVLPLLDVYRRYYGWRFAAYIFCVFFVAMAASGVVMDLVFHASGLVPDARPDIRAHVEHFSLNYTFWLNVVFGASAVWLWRKGRVSEMAQHCCH